MERQVGGGIGMGNTCKSMADSFQCMTKPTTIKKKSINILSAKYHIDISSILFCACTDAKSLQLCDSFPAPWIVACQAPLSARILEWVALPSFKGSS